MMQKCEEQLMAGLIPAVGSAKRRQTQKKTRFSARMAKMAKGVPTESHPSVGDRLFAGDRQEMWSRQP
jgi:hypothetical protein